MSKLTEEKAKLLGSLILFTQTFYKLRTGRDFEISAPVGRESHFITICRELHKVFNLEVNRLLINIPPGHGKSELMIHFVPWAMAHYPDSAFLYISYGIDLAVQHTYTIKQIMQMSYYQKLFDVEVKRDSSAKDNFQTKQGGAVRAYGSSGGVTGQNAGLPGLDRFSGAVIMDDMHKPEQVHSDTVREHVKRNYAETIEPRPRGPNVPIIFIGQRLHEDDLPNSFIKGEDGYEWKKVILRGLDDAGNALHPTVMPKDKLLIMKNNRPYVFFSQQQQDPIPAGGGLFKEEYFIEMFEEPKILSTFITCDTAETEHTYNDPTVFSFWGIYKIIDCNIDVGLYALHWLDCIEFWCEPADLEQRFNEFYMKCMQYPIKPMTAAIEKKNTGVTLISLLKRRPGLQILEIERPGGRGSLSKTDRFLNVQQYIASKRVTLPYKGNHNGLVINHCKKITANNTHAHDDIADTMEMAVKLALIDQTLIYHLNNNNDEETANTIMSKYLKVQQLRNNVYGY